MPKINSDQRAELKEILSDGLVWPVGIVLFTRKRGRTGEEPAEPTCEYCEDVEELMSEVVGLSNKLSLEVLDFDAEADEAEKYGIKDVPVIIPVAQGDSGLRYYGMPGGYEFAALLQAIVNVSSGGTQLSDESVEALSTMPGPVDIKVFATTT